MGGHMGYRPEEFTAAFAKAAEIYPFINVTTAQLVLYNFDRGIRQNRRRKLSEREPYGLQIRYALNDSNIEGKSFRKAYASVIGYLYGKHGNFISQRYRTHPELRPAVPQFPKETNRTGVSEKPNGQKTWEF